jgi:hypothetical protein
MELLILAAFVGVLFLGAWAGKRAEGMPAEPWILAVGAILLLWLAWGSGENDRGPQILLTLGAVAGLYRAASIVAKRRRGDPAP